MSQMEMLQSVLVIRQKNSPSSAISVIPAQTVHVLISATKQIYLHSTTHWIEFNRCRDFIISGNRKDLRKKDLMTRGKLVLPRRKLKNYFRKSCRLMHPDINQLTTAG